MISLIIITLLSVLIYMGYSKKLEIRRLNIHFDSAVMMFQAYTESAYMQNKLYENTIKENTDALIKLTEMLRAGIVTTMIVKSDQKEKAEIALKILEDASELGKADLRKVAEEAKETILQAKDEMLANIGSGDMLK